MSITSPLRFIGGLAVILLGCGTELAYSGNSASHNPLVNQLPNLITNAHVVSASGLVIDPADTQWNVHVDHDSTVTFGQRYAEKMKEALHW